MVYNTPTAPRTVPHTATHPQSSVHTQCARNTEICPHMPTNQKNTYVIFFCIYNFLSHHKVCSCNPFTHRHSAQGTCSTCWVVVGHTHRHHNTPQSSVHTVCTQHRNMPTHANIFKKPDTSFFFGFIPLFHVYHSFTFTRFALVVSGSIKHEGMTVERIQTAETCQASWA